MRSQNHSREADRLAFLYRLMIVETGSEQIYDDFVALAASVCDTPIALVSLVLEGRQCFKAKVGLGIDSTSREVSFCSHAILESGPMVIDDATLDPRFRDNDLVTGDFHLRFYAGVPITVEELPVGTLCVIDTEPRTLTESQIKSLTTLARQLSALLESRLAHIRLAEAEEKLRFTEATLDNVQRRSADLFQNLAVASYTTGNDGTIFEFNRGAEELFGFLAHEALGRNDVELLVGDDFQEDALLLRSLVAGGQRIDNRERKMRKADGNQIMTLYSTHPVSEVGGSIIGATHVFLDIGASKQRESELLRANTSLEFLARTDGLTQVKNRVAIMEVLESEFKSVSRYPISVIMLDVDNFKEYNDASGHPEGDKVLRQIALLLSSNLRPGDEVGRYGGEEFVVLLPRTDIDVASAIAERLRSSIENHAWTHRAITISAGAASSTEVTDSYEKLLSLADVRLYSAKSAGRNCVVSGESQAQSAA